MSTKDQTLSAELHGEALLTAKRPELQPLIEPPRVQWRAGSPGSGSCRVLI
jgi:hypothetical protein